jgi:hypothetical protein
VKAYEIANPVPVGFLGTVTVMAHPDRLAKLITKPGAACTLLVHGLTPFFANTVFMVSIIGSGKRRSQHIE